MTFGFALAGLTHDYHILSFKVVVANLLVPSHDDKPVGVSSSVAHAVGLNLGPHCPQSTSKLQPVKFVKALQVSKSAFRSYAVTWSTVWRFCGIPEVLSGQFARARFSHSQWCNSMGGGQKDYSQFSPIRFRMMGKLSKLRVTEFGEYLRLVFVMAVLICLWIHRKTRALPVLESVNALYPKVTTTKKVNRQRTCKEKQRPILH